MLHEDLLGCTSDRVDKVPDFKVAYSNFGQGGGPRHATDTTIRFAKQTATYKTSPGSLMDRRDERKRERHTHPYTHIHTERQWKGKLGCGFDNPRLPTSLSLSLSLSDACPSIAKPKQAPALLQHV